MEPTPGNRIHIFGASGSGTTTLGRALAMRFDSPHFDSDDYFWQKTDPPFVLMHTPEQRVAMLAHDLLDKESWVLSGSLCVWGDVFIPKFTLAVYLWIPPELRMRRILERERQRYGARIDAGGDMYEVSRKFRDWAARYDTAGLEQRSRVSHEAWTTSLNCPLLRIESNAPVSAWVAEVVAAIGDTRVRASRQ